MLRYYFSLGDRNFWRTWLEHFLYDRAAAFLIAERLACDLVKQQVSGKVPIC